MTSDADVSPDHQAIARHVAAIFGGDPRVIDYANKPETRFVGILSAADRPGPGVTSYSTIKLSDYPLPYDGGEFPARLELAGACASDIAAFPNLLATTAFHIMQARVLYRPGSAIPNLARDAGVSSSLPHVYLTAPFLWGPALNELAAGTKMVTWLLAMPIAETELAYLREHGDDALETLFEEQRIDIFNVERPAVV